MFHRSEQYDQIKQIHRNQILNTFSFKIEIIRRLCIFKSEFDYLI